MDGQGEHGEAELSVDASACAAYVREMRESLHLDLFAQIVDGHGAVLWTDDEVRASQHEPQLRKVPLPSASAVMQTLAQGWVLYQLPFLLPGNRQLALRLAVHDEAPPRLADLEALVGDALQCLRRQIEIDFSLTQSLPASVAARMEALSERYTFSGTDTREKREKLARLCEQWRHKYGVTGMAVNLPADEILASDCSMEEIRSRLPRILRKLARKQSSDDRVVKARLKIDENTTVAVVARAITDTQRNTSGTLVLIDEPSNPNLERLARQLAARLSQWLNQQQPHEDRLMSRSELLDAIGAARRRQPNELSSLLYIDADKIHAINDAFGYSAGDSALTSLGRVLRELCGNRGITAHLGSDRFAMFLPGASSEQAAAVAQKILREYSIGSIDDEHRSITFSASVGIATMSDEAEKPDNMLIVAEVAARAAKERGGNQYALHQDIDDSVIQRRSDVDKVGFMQMALIENKFVLFAQRIAPLTEERNNKFEILTRLEIDGNTIGHPGEMLSAAERYHMMTALDRWVVNNALMTLARSENTLEVNLSTYCINVSAQSLQDDSFVDHIEARIAETGVAADTLCFEITETSLVKNIDRAQRFIARLQRMGCQVALDDFGTGYSSFAYLKHLPVDYLKIDGSFVRDMAQSALSRAIVASIVRIAAVTGATTVAEHVETTEVRDMLADLGIDYVQGFAVHRPEPLRSVLSGTATTFTEVSETDEMIDLDEYTQPARDRA